MPSNCEECGRPDETSGGHVWVQRRLLEKPLFDGKHQAGVCVNEDFDFLGNVLLLDFLELRERDIVGLILLPPNTANVLSHLPLDITVGDTEYRFLLVVFLSNMEHEVRKTKGHDALMDLFDNTNKDLVSFGTTRASGRPALRLLANRFLRDRDSRSRSAE
jgi:hypothetical protein